MISNLVIITGPDIRHQYLVRRINREFPIQCVFIEQLSYPEISGESAKERSHWDWFFRRREEYENRLWAESEKWTFKNDPEMIPLPCGTLNTEATLTTLQSLRPDLILLFGSSLVGEDILRIFQGSILNLHLGISSEYRGSSCNFWPIHDKRLDLLGATLMNINTGVDTGEILAQGTIRLDEGDTEQTLMGKTLVLGADLTVHTLRQWTQGKLRSTPLARQGRLYRKADFSFDAIGRVRTLVETGNLRSLIEKRLLEK